MTKKTTYTRATTPKSVVYGLNGVMLAMSHRRHASGQIEFWNSRDKN